MGVVSIPVAILPSSQVRTIIALQLHKHKYSWVVKITSETPQRQYSGYNTPLGHHTDRGPTGLGQYNSLGEYCGPCTASSVFLISLLAVDNHSQNEINSRLQ